MLPGQMQERLARLCRYRALVRGSGKPVSQPAFEALCVVFEQFLDGEDWQEELVAHLLGECESHAEHEDEWAQSLASAPARKARVVPSPPQVRFVLERLRKG